MYLGRIVTKNKKLVVNEFIDITSDIKLNIDEIKIPTMIVGKKNAENIVGIDKVKLLDRKISDNLYWTFAKTERRNEYEKDIKWFSDMVVKNLQKNINYYHFNFFTEPISHTKALIRYIYSDRKKYFYITDNHIYIYCDNRVIGLSILDMKYIGINLKKHIAKLKNNESNKIITDEYSTTKKIKKQVNGNKIMVPYVFFLENN